MRVGKGRTFGPMTSWLLPRTKSFGHPFDQSKWPVRFGYFGEDVQTQLLKERASLILASHRLCHSGLVMLVGCVALEITALETRLRSHIGCGKASGVPCCTASLATDTPRFALHLQPRALATWMTGSSCKNLVDSANLLESLHVR